MIDDDLAEAAAATLDTCRKHRLMVTAAESCTGGLVLAALTSIAGSSDVVERGFVTYSNEAKQEMIGVAPDSISVYGAVSEQCAREMAEGALAHSRAQIAVSVTGIAGPSGGSPEKPVGLVHLACAGSGIVTHHRRLLLGAIGRGEIRRQSVLAAFNLIADAAMRIHIARTTGRP